MLQMHIYSISEYKPFQMVAKTLFGLESLFAEEIIKLGASDVEVLKRAVSFSGTKDTMYRINLHSRYALRVLVRLASFEVNNENELYDAIYSLPWESFLSQTDTLAIDTVLHTEVFNHSQYISQRTKDAICDRFRSKFNERPSVDLENPTLRIHLSISKNTCHLFFDSSGDSLHKRAYRQDANLAPINEVLASGMIGLSGWDAKSSFIDAMTGSGTILIEAAMRAANIAPGLVRQFYGFKNWQKQLAFDEVLWQELLDEAESSITKPEIPLIGYELSPNVIRKAKTNAARSLTGPFVQLRTLDFFNTVKHEPVGETPTLIANPPYGQRMEKDETEELYKQIGSTFKRNFDGFDCWVISSNMEALKKIGLAPKLKIPLFNGALDCRFNKYPMYKGTKRIFDNDNSEIPNVSVE